jgi:hypothetical protein
METKMEVSEPVVDRPIEMPWLMHRYLSQNKSCLICAESCAFNALRQKKIESTDKLKEGNCILVCEKCETNPAPLPEWAKTFSKAVDLVIEFTHAKLSAVRKC